MSVSDRFRGCLLGLALGDALGAPFEGGVFAGVVWRAIGLRSPGVLRYTDDGEMALASAESLVACGGFDVDHMARTWAERCSWDRGYGPGARKVLALIRDGVPWREANTRVFPQGSFGNGAAMRAAPLGLFFRGDAAALDAATIEASRVTHAHPLGLQGGLLLARATALALRDEADLLAALDTADLDAEYRRRLGDARRLGRALPAEVVAALGHGVAAHESAVTAVYAAVRHFGAPFEDLMTFVVSLGGDVDTIAAMAGAVWGARNGAARLPAEPLARLEDRARFEAAAAALAAQR